MFQHSKVPPKTPYRRDCVVKYPQEGRLWGADSGLGAGEDSTADVTEGWHWVMVMVQGEFRMGLEKWFHG